MNIPEQQQKQVDEAHTILDELEKKGEPAAPVEADPQPNVQPNIQSNDETDWKLRFVNYKRSTDITIHDLRQEATALKTTINTLNDKLEKWAPIIEEYDKVQTDKVKEQLANELGDDTAKVLDSYIDKVVDPLKQENSELKQKLAGVENMTMSSLAESNKMSVIDKVRHAVGPLVFDTVDNDPNFIAFLDHIDPLSGLSIKEQIQEAITSNNLSYVASVYAQFANSQRQTNSNPFENAFGNRTEDTAPNPNNNQLETRMVPTDNMQPNSSTPTPDTRIWRSQDIRQFYIDKVNGLVAPEDAAKIKKSIELAVLEGRVE